MVILYILFAVLILYLIFIQIKLLKTRNDVINEFKNLDKLLKSKYSLVNSIINENSVNLLQINSLKEYILKQQVYISSLEAIPENIDRRIALDWDLDNKTNELITYIKSNSESSYINDFDTIQIKIINNKIKYNNKAKKLRHLVDVFPSSFLARLNKIKYFNTIK